MGIKWNDNWVIATTLLNNQIVIGKLDTKSKYPIFADKSPDRAEQAVSAVKKHMENLFKSSEITGDSAEKEHYTFTFSDGSRLVYYPPNSQKE